MRFYSGFFFFLAAILLLGSCTGIERIEKRRYRPGFYLQTKHNQAGGFSVQKELCRKEIAPVNAGSFSGTKKTDSIVSAVQNRLSEKTILSRTKQAFSKPAGIFSSEKESKKKDDPEKKSKKTRSAKASFWIAGIFFFLALVTLAILIGILAAGGLPFGGVLAIIICIPLLVLYLILGFFALFNGIKTRRSGEPEPVPEKKEEKTPVAPGEKAKNLVDFAFIFLILGILIPVMPLVGIILSATSLSIMKKNKIDDPKTKKRAKLELLIGLLYYVVGFILLLLTGS